MRFSRAFALVLVSSSMPSLPYGNGAAVQVLLPALAFQEPYLGTATWTYKWTERMTAPPG